MGELDSRIPPQWTETMRDVFIKLGANVKFESNPNFGHHVPENMGAYINKWLYENIPGTGFDQ